MLTMDGDRFIRSEADWIMLVGLVGCAFTLGFIIGSLVLSVGGW